MIRVCVCTSNEAGAEPRAPRHAVSVAEISSDIEVIFVDSAPIGGRTTPSALPQRLSNIHCLTHRFASRSSSSLRLIFHRLWQWVARMLFRVTGAPVAAALSTRAIGLQRELVAIAADVYIAHNIDTLMPAAIAARQRDSLLMFDSMEYHAQMGDGQSSVERALIDAIQRRYLPQCHLVLTSSDAIADILEREYAIKRPLPLYNVPPKETELMPKPEQGLVLYWRNAVVGLGQRGLEDALVAMQELPADVVLHLQGKMPMDGGAQLRKCIADLGLQSRVVILPPYSPDDAVREASRHHIGLCLERPGIRNHELTVSNKMFDYHMAGLAIIASNLPALRKVLELSAGGLLFNPGSPSDLAGKINMLYADRDELRRLGNNARRFAMREANREVEMEKFATAFTTTCSANHKM
jgi:glycogen(starch) synthase